MAWLALRRSRGGHHLGKGGWGRMLINRLSRALADSASETSECKLELPRAFRRPCSSVVSVPSTPQRLTGVGFKEENRVSISFLISDPTAKRCLEIRQSDGLKAKQNVHDPMPTVESLPIYRHFHAFADWRRSGLGLINTLYTATGSRLEFCRSSIVDPCGNLVSPIPSSRLQRVITP